MSKFSDLTTPTNRELFFRRNDRNDVRLGEIVPQTTFQEADIVILGCPQDEGVARSNGRTGAALAPDAIRQQFYKLTPFGISARIFDAGNTKIGETLEETHDTQAEIVMEILEAGKKIIILGGGGDISYPDGFAMAQVFGEADWIAINIDAHFDVRADRERSNGTQYRQLLEEKFLRPDYFYELGFQPHFASPVYYRYLQNLGVNLVSLDQLRSRETSDLELRELMRQKFVHHSQLLSTFFGFDISAIRSSDAPGTSTPSPIGLRGGEFLNLVNFAAKLVNTRIVEFTEVNPNFDVDHRTTKLVAIAMHRFCSSVTRLSL